MFKSTGYQAHQSQTNNLHYDSENTASILYHIAARVVGASGSEPRCHPVCRLTSITPSTLKWRQRLFEGHEVLRHDFLEVYQKGIDRPLVNETSKIVSTKGTRIPNKLT